MIELPDLPVPIEEMYFFTAPRKDGVVRLVGSYNDPTDDETKKMLVGTYPNYRSAISALGEVARLQALHRALMR